MKKKLQYIALLLFSINSNLFSQKIINKDNYTFLVQKEVGDLNNDKLNDKVMVEMDEKEDTRPLRLQIFLSQADKKLQLVVSSSKIIESQYPKEKNGKYNGNPIPDFFIEEGKLIMLTDINNRKSKYTFRYKNESFELINISRVIWDGKNATTETTINFLTRKKEKFSQELGSDKILNKKITSIQLSKIPKIQDLNFSDLEKY